MIVRHRIFGRLPGLIGTIGLLLAIGMSAVVHSTVAADSPLAGPVTALAAINDRLLIGQGSRFIDARLTPNGLQITATRDLNIGAIRSIAARPDGSTLVLGEAALAALDPTDTVTDVQSMGGQQVVLNGDQVFVAALEAGIRRLQWHAGLLSAEPDLVTGASAESIALAGTDRLWVAEGTGGIWEYTLTTNPPSILFGDKTRNPARMVRASGDTVIVGYGNNVAVLDSQNARLPRVIAGYALDMAAQAGDARLTDDGHLLIGQVAAAGADLIVLPLKNDAARTDRPIAPQPIAQGGDSGGGEQIAQVGSTLFYGSLRGGLSQVVLNGTQFNVITAWGSGSATACTTDDYRPEALNPAAGGLVKANPDGSITLAWSALCPADHYRVQINDLAAVVVDQPVYSFHPAAVMGALTWQITAQVGDGAAMQTINGARWTAEIAASGLLALPIDPDPNAVLYHAPLAIGPGFVPQTPLGKLLIVMLLVGGGSLVIAIGGSLIGRLSARRRTP